LRKNCNHPALVLKTPEDIEKVTPLGSGALNVRDVVHAPKLEALRFVSFLGPASVFCVLMRLLRQAIANGLWCWCGTD
jgi:hypothetical protein